MPNNEEIRRSLFEAICDDNLESVREIVNRYGLSYCQAWSRGYTLLYNATKFRRDEIAKFLVQKGAKVNSTNSSVDTPLHYAAKKGSPELVEMLIDQHASVNAQNQAKDTPLRIATRNERANIVGLLLRGGADCWTDDEPLLTACRNGYAKIAKLLLKFREQKKFLSQEPLNLALVLASRNGSEEIVSALLEASADPNAIIDNTPHQYLFGNTKCSPLFVACAGGHLGVVKLLLDKGGQLNYSRQGDNYTLFHAASANGHVEVVSHLLNLGVDPNAEAHDKVTSLHLAAKVRRYIELVTLLLNHGANVNAQTSNGLTPLHFAAQNGYEETTKILLERGACVRTRDKEGNTALHLAVEAKNSFIVHQILQHNPDVDDKIRKSIIDIAVNDHWHYEFVELLIEYGCTLSREDVSDHKLLPAAVKKGYVKIVKCILEYGLDRNDNIYDSSLLHVAVENGHPEIIELLLKSGYDINGQDKRGNKPIFYSMRCEKKGQWIKVFQVLLANGAIVENASSFLYHAVDKECLEMCKILIENGADVNALNILRNISPLLVIVSKGAYSGEEINETSISTEIVKLLLSNGANVSFETRTGVTALHLAAHKGKTEAVRVLLNFGADVYSRAKAKNISHDDFFRFLFNPIENGPTALHLAAEGGHTEVVKVLLEFDADMYAREGDNNRTALEHAISQDHDEVVKVLLENGYDINIKNGEGKTVLDLAFEKCKSSYTVERTVADDEDDCYDSDEEYDSDEDDYFVTPVKPEDHMVSNTLKMHAIKLKAAGFHVIEKILQQVEATPLLVDFQRACEEELRKLKNEKCGSHLTLYDILVDSKNPAYARNESLRQTLESLNFDNYPVYGSLVVNSVERNKRRIKLLTSGQESLRVLVKTYSSLNGKESPVVPDEVSEEILSYLTNRELRALILTGEGLKNQICK